MELAHVLQTTQLTVKSHRTTVTDLISRNKSGKLLAAYLLYSDGFMYFNEV
jgi:hypothetical protein